MPPAKKTPAKKTPAKKTPAKKTNSKPISAKKAVKVHNPHQQEAPRKYISQEDVPAYPLTDALRVGRSIVDQYGGRATTPLNVAAALELAPASSTFRMLTGSSIAYGITSGGYNAQEIALTSLGRKLLEPTAEGDDAAAMREAVLRPRVIREFLSRYSGASLPRNDIAINVLKTLGVPAERCDAVHQLRLRNAADVGFLRTIRDKQYVDLGGASSPRLEQPHTSDTEPAPMSDVPDAGLAADAPPTAEVNGSLVASTTNQRGDSAANRRVFITHGKNMAFIEPIKKLLGFGEMIPIVSVERQSVSQPVPDKVMNDMRSCSAAIIHVDGEQKLLDSAAQEHTVINPNVLIEIGAAMALFGRRFILLVRDGIKLPSNLQGLYEVRYQGDALDGNATIKLLEAINDIKNNPLPPAAPG